ncbi:MAG: hypothetical protein QOC83_5089, partial [Pseudonocardiales bacterium]|nr:hypothetical protein [Pseudonocardiales bacterium]
GRNRRFGGAVDKASDGAAGAQA